MSQLGTSNNGEQDHARLPRVFQVHHQLGNDMSKALSNVARLANDVDG
jgi:hypothetical protein